MNRIPALTRSKMSAREALFHDAEAREEVGTYIHGCLRDIPAEIAEGKNLADAKRRLSAALLIIAGIEAIADIEGI